MPEEAQVVYQSKDGKREKVFDALEWLAAMSSHVPEKGEQMVRYYGLKLKSPKTPILRAENYQFCLKEGSIMRNTRSSRSVIPFCVPLCCLFLIGFVTSANAQNVCGPSNPVANPAVLGGVMCQQVYALCIAAPCVEVDSPQLTGKEGDTFTIGGGFATAADIRIPHVECSCLTIIGNNIGQPACDTLAPDGRARNGDQILSTYSFQLNNDQFQVLTCDPEDFSRPLFYADCYNQPCTIDSTDPDKATCKCPVFLAERPFITRGGGCQQDSCLENILCSTC